MVSWYNSAAMYMTMRLAVNRTSHTEGMVVQHALFPASYLSFPPDVDTMRKRVDRTSSAVLRTGGPVSAVPAGAPTSVQLWGPVTTTSNPSQEGCAQGLADAAVVSSFSTKPAHVGLQPYE